MQFDYAAQNGQPVTEDHRRFCASYGHVAYDSPICPRCGVNVNGTSWEEDYSDLNEDVYNRHVSTYLTDEDMDAYND